MTNFVRVRALVVFAVSLLLVISVSKLHPLKGVRNGVSMDVFTAALDERIPELMKTYGIPGANIVLVDEGKVTWTKAYGYADLETGRKMTTDTYLRVESISKPITAWGVMKLVEQGKIRLDAPVKQYLRSWALPESEFPEEEMTVRHLLSHTAGLPLGDFNRRYSPTEEIPSLRDCLSKDAVLIQEPGASFLYSNVGFNLLELLIEEVTGRDFAEYMQQEILIPLGMYNSSFVWSEELKPEVPNGHDLSGRTIPVYVYPEKGSGGLFATAEDIAIFIAAGMPGFSPAREVLSPQSIDALYTPVAHNLGLYSLVFDSYGLGYYIENLEGGKQAVSHGGQGAGWMTHFHSVPKTGDGIVILTNSQRSWPFIAYILSDWAEWIGISSVGMGRIIWGKYVLWTLIGLVWFIALWQVWRLGEDLVAKRRRFAPLSRHSCSLRLTQGILSAVLMSGLLWCVNQDYLFISSVFPIASGWLGISLFALAAVMLLSALCPSL